jgi:radical SAM-linked protein
MSEIRQRWRLVFARGEEARYLSHLDAVKGWERAFRRGEIPVATSEGFSPRPKLVFAAPLQLGMLAEHELADLFLAEKLTAPDLRDRLAAGMPRGYRVLDLHDVWVGASAIAPRLAAADYRMTLLNVEQAQLAAAAERLMAAERLPRERRKETRSIAYDLRALLLELRVGPPEPAAVPPAAGGVAAGMAAAGLWMRLRHSQSLGSGRADEVVAALADEMGVRTLLASGASDDGEANGTAGVVPETVDNAGSKPPLEVVRPVRERLWLDDELDPAAAP